MYVLYVYEMKRNDKLSNTDTQSNSYEWSHLRGYLLWRIEQVSSYSVIVFTFWLKRCWWRYCYCNGCVCVCVDVRSVWRWQNIQRSGEPTGHYEQHTHIPWRIPTRVSGSPSSSSFIWIGSAWHSIALHCIGWVIRRSQHMHYRLIYIELHCIALLLWKTAVYVAANMRVVEDSYEALFSIRAGSDIDREGVCMWQHWHWTLSNQWRHCDTDLGFIICSAWTSQPRFLE